MKISRLVARILLGLVFTVFGLNGFFHFLPMPPPVNLVAGRFMGALAESGYMLPVLALEIIAGILLLVNRYVPLALALLAPVLVNILMFHGLMAPEGLPIAVICTLLWVLLFIGDRSAFAGLIMSPDRV